MFSTKSRQDFYRLILPEHFIVDDISEKYAKILQDQHGFFYRPIDYLNESIQKIQILGFSEATSSQIQHNIGHSLHNDPNREAQNRFLHTGTDFIYRSEVNPLQLIDKTLNITFKHNLGFINYFMMFENFWHYYARDTEYKNMEMDFTIDILNYDGTVYSKIKLYGCILHGMDMLDLDYSQPIAQSQTFQVTFKYSNIDFEFVTDNIKHNFLTE
jgi:hypothetical protein